MGPWTTFKIPDGGALFNLAEDPGERQNLADTQPQRVEAMRQELEAIKNAQRTRP